MNETKTIILELLKDLIMIQSTEDNPQGLALAVGMIRNHLGNIPGILIEEHSCGGKPSLVARSNFTAPIEVMLVGHVDVVEAKEELFFPREEGNRIYGRGAGDMKGQVTILTEAFKEIMTKNPAAPIALMITADEESGGENGAGYLAGQARYKCRTAIIPDSGGPNEIVVVEKGILSGRIRCRGVSGHSAQPWLCDNAVHRLMKNLQALVSRFETLEQAPDNWRHTLSVNILATENRAANRIPDLAEASIDVRFTEDETSAGMMEFIQKHLDERTEFIPDFTEEPLETAPDPLFIKITEEITGKPVVLKKAHGGSDGGFFTKNGAQAIMSRPNVGGLHSSSEWIEVDSMFQYYKILKQYLNSRLA